MLVGHEPDLGELASWLLTGSKQRVRMPLKKAGAVAIAMEDPPVLLWMLGPRALRELGEA